MIKRICWLPFPSVIARYHTSRQSAYRRFFDSNGNIRIPVVEGSGNTTNKNIPNYKRQTENYGGYSLKKRIKTSGLANAWLIDLHHSKKYCAMITNTQIRTQIVRKINRIPVDKLKELDDFVSGLEEGVVRNSKTLSFAGVWRDIDDAVFNELTNNLISNRQRNRRRIDE